VRTLYALVGKAVLTFTDKTICRPKTAFICGSYSYRCAFFSSMFRLFITFENDVLPLINKVRGKSKFVLGENRIYECNVEIIVPISQISRLFEG
jgi:hypothetical protein